MEDRIFQLLVEQNDISWKSIIYDLINAEKMDPWDVNITLLTQKFLERLHELREKDLKLSGKLILAAAMLLKMKSVRLVSVDLEEFDRLLAGDQLDAGEFYDELENELQRGEEYALDQQVELVPRLPEARKRKMSVYELVRALEKALEVKKRRLWNAAPQSVMQMPERKWDLGGAIKTVYGKITDFFAQQAEVFFSHLLSTQSKEEKIRTFLSLLHLSNQRKVELSQDVPFGDIKISLMKEAHADAV